MSESEYTVDLSKDRCRLTLAHRKIAYSIFQRYNIFCKSNGLWDAMDLVSAVFQERKLKAQSEGMFPVLYDRVYADEVQDFTQAEIGLLFMLAGNNHKALIFSRRYGPKCLPGSRFSV